MRKQGLHFNSRYEPKCAEPTSPEGRFDGADGVALAHRLANTFVGRFEDFKRLQGAMRGRATSKFLESLKQRSKKVLLAPLIPRKCSASLHLSGWILKFKMLWAGMDLASKARGNAPRLGVWL
jgi:hypothetical protein